MCIDKRTCTGTVYIRTYMYTHVHVYNYVYAYTCTCTVHTLYMYHKPIRSLKKKLIIGRNLANLEEKERKERVRESE